MVQRKAPKRGRSAKVLKRATAPGFIGLPAPHAVSRPTSVDQLPETEVAPTEPKRTHQARLGLFFFTTPHSGRR